MRNIRNKLVSTETHFLQKRGTFETNEFPRKLIFGKNAKRSPKMCFHGNSVLAKHSKTNEFPRKLIFGENAKHSNKNEFPQKFTFGKDAKHSKQNEFLQKLIFGNKNKHKISFHRNEFPRKLINMRTTYISTKLHV